MAFGELYTRYLDAIYRYIYFRVGDTHEAEDLTETVFLKAWQAIPGYRDIGLKFSSWLYRIAHNVVIDFHRKCRSDPLYQPDCASDEDIEVSALISNQIRDVEETSTLAQAISKLSEDQQQIILLRFIEGLSHTEISRMMNRTEGACRMLQNRALIALHQQLSGI